MTLYTEGNISRYYAETLVLLFFPGSKFPVDGSGGEPVIRMTVEHSSDIAVGKVTITEGDREVSSEYSPSHETHARVSEEMLLKLSAGGAMLRAGEEFCKTLPPWGMITGVRPAKLCLDMLEAGLSEDEVLKRLCEDFLADEHKVRLAVTTAKKELLYVSDTRRRECSVYIAIPFCPTRCTYCSFVSFSSPKLLGLIPDYLKRLFVDIKNTFDIIKSLGLRIATVYIGGGTPTTLDAVQLELLLSCVSEQTDISALDEFTVEAGRPDTITAEKMEVLARYGVTRVSVNAQTMNDDVLRSIGRRHNSEDFLRAYDCARESGIRDINVDLIAGLPGEHHQSFSDSVDKIISLAPSNITVHTFYVKRAADIKNNTEVYRAEDENAVCAVNSAQRQLRLAGYEPYYLYKQKNTTGNLENAGFCLNGHECLYNIFMMEEIHTVFGAGASAMTKLVSPTKKQMKIKRICETKYPYEYLDVEKGSSEKRFTELWDASHAFYRDNF